MVAHQRGSIAPAFLSAHGGHSAGSEKKPRREDKVDERQTIREEDNSVLGLRTTLGNKIEIIFGKTEITLVTAYESRTNTNTNIDKNADKNAGQ